MRGNAQVGFDQVEPAQNEKEACCQNSEKRKWKDIEVKAPKRRSKKTLMPHLTGFRGPDPKVGKATQFKPGLSGNPGGRPKKLISAAYEELANKKVPNDPKGRTYAEVLAEGQFRAAIKGMTQAAKEITDRLEGKAPQPVELSGPEGGGVNVDLHIHFVDAAKPEELLDPEAAGIDEGG